MSSRGGTPCSAAIGGRPRLNCAMRRLNYALLRAATPKTTSLTAEFSPVPRYSPDTRPFHRLHTTIKVPSRIRVPSLKARAPQPITFSSPPRERAPLRPSRIRKTSANKPRALFSTTQRTRQTSKPSKKPPQTLKTGRRKAPKTKFTLPFRFRSITDQSKSARELRQDPTTALTPFLVNLTAN
jgi:hypothetical protein